MLLRLPRSPLAHAFNHSSFLSILSPTTYLHPDISFSRSLSLSFSLFFFLLVRSPRLGKTGERQKRKYTIPLVVTSLTLHRRHTRKRICTKRSGCGCFVRSLLLFPLFLSRSLPLFPHPPSSRRRQQAGDYGVLMWVNNTSRFSLFFMEKTKTTQEKNTKKMHNEEEQEQSKEKVGLQKKSKEKIHYKQSTTRIDRPELKAKHLISDLPTAQSFPSCHAGG